jgi:hypothetical protein
MWKVYLFGLIVTVIVSVIWVAGIDKMKTNYPDYKGEDFLNFDQDETE